MKKVISRRDGKVRSIYMLDSNEVLLVTHDRLSVFDAIVPILIQDKGKILNQLSTFWFKWMRQFEIASHFITDDFDEMDVDLDNMRCDNGDCYTVEYLRGRVMLCKKTYVYPVEAIVRGYLTGSGWKEYQAKGTLAGQALPQGIPLCGQLPNGCFTPSTKAESGHDENITFERMQSLLGDAYHPTGDTAADKLRDIACDLFKKASEYAKERSIIIADTKFEFGYVANAPQGVPKRLVIDEVLTPDSSRFWDATTYEPGKEQPSMDKDIMRKYYMSIGYAGDGEAPAPPADVIDATRNAYINIFTRLTGKEPVL